MSPRRGLDLGIIVAAATEIADTVGFEEITLASLASRLGVRSPSLYNHVDGLPALKSHLVTHGLNQLNEAIKAASGTNQTRGKIIAIADAYLLFARNHPGLYELTLRAPTAEQPEQMRLGSEIVESLVAALSIYKSSEEKAVHAVRGLRSILHGFASIEKSGGFGMALEVNDSITFVLNSFLNGLEE
ncbi:WHG domain-containing protein [Paenibacillus sp. GSMTC-2017]|uniref:TetR/AcrR family transcriptional regulator n=1 Tax=Paenibacillus sp. GSMTC-2017 TaxID=2794350 RepID=UPI0018D6BA9E|nr:TetR-like C-terminal domain-containing protein [Paenibacillus sp. GSMTC-2017]MBH5319174.1 WHG domain-containing protein [Paenibacillus sp. GSMTC-2017]